jgi:hypothetical protein
MRLLSVWLGLLCFLALACGGDDVGAIGSACSESGATTGQCAAGSVCGAHADIDASQRCLKVCTQQSDCASGEDCNGVDGSSLKGCRLKVAPGSGSSGSGGK